MIELGDIISARQVISGRVHRTPLVSSMTLGKRTDTHLHFKAEVFQKTGSFKPRGSLNKLYHLTEAERKRGVVTVSSRNLCCRVSRAGNGLGPVASLEKNRGLQLVLADIRPLLLIFGM